MLDKIENIIFDLGGVILDIDFKLSIDEFTKKGLKEAETIFKHEELGEIFIDLELGKISQQQFYSIIKKYFNYDIDIEEIKFAWNALLLDYTVKRIEILKKLKQNYRTFLLSNTNIIHRECYEKLLYEKYNIKSLSCLFEKAYYSDEINLRKPDKEAFLYVKEKSKIDFEKTLFLDDFKVNTDAANNLGIKTILVSKENNLEKIFSNI